MKKLPIGIQTFREIITGNYVYVDKTREAFEIVENYKYVFLSRPRRFGKSLFLSTLKEIFEGNKELFKGLFIYDKYDFPKYPVIKISWEGELKTISDIKIVCFDILDRNKKHLGLSEKLDKAFSIPSVYFKNLIESAYEKYKRPVVILIDEYDKPILDNIENLDVAYEAREFLREFYGVIKGMDEYIRFVFITGVSRFSKVSIFSGLNNLEDISLTPKFAYICGYLHENLEREFKEHLEGADLERVREWYNGYNFLGEECVYNPFDILLFIRNGFEFRSYWFETGTPSFLIKLVKERGYNPLNFERIEADERILSSFDIDRLDLITIMFQAGYLTIKEIIRDEIGTSFVLSFPNYEVKRSFNAYLFDYLIEVSGSEALPLLRKFYRAFKEERLLELENLFKAFLGMIPYTTYVRNALSRYEGFYGAILYMFFAGGGFKVVLEDFTPEGRIDMTLFVEDKVYLFEFKVDRGEPIEQIYAKNYAEKYSDRPKIYAIGLLFDSKSRFVTLHSRRD